MHRGPRVRPLLRFRGSPATLSAQVLLVGRDGTPLCCPLLPSTLPIFWGLALQNGTSSSLGINPVPECPSHPAVARPWHP